VQREFIDLTPSGETEARRVFARHNMLTRFLQEVLRMPADTAAQEACAMEHSLSSAGLEHLTRFFEFVHACPEGKRLLEKFHGCAKVHDDKQWCAKHCPDDSSQAHLGRPEQTRLAELEPGDQAHIAQINGSSELRQRILDMGLLPDVVVEIDRAGDSDGNVRINVEGFQLRLTGEEANALVVERTHSAPEDNTAEVSPHSSLVDVEIDRLLRVVAIDADHGAILKLMSMGLEVGDRLRVLRRSPLRGPLVVEHRGSEIAIGHGLAKKILVALV
jgi:Fe2+ transport system protein FeoA